MKQKFILSILAVAFGALSASANTEERFTVNAGNVENITISSDMNVVLIPISNNNGLVTLEQSASEKVNMRISGNRLNLSLAKSISGKEKTTVYLYVGKLKTITVESNCQVKTLGVLNAPKINLYVDGNSTVHLRSNGQIDAYALSDAEINVKYISGNPMAKR
jgi:hypothetical protein